MRYLGFVSLITLISHFFFISLAFRALQGLRLDRYIIPERQKQFSLVLVMVAVVLGFGLSSFFLSLVDNVRSLGYLLG